MSKNYKFEDFTFTKMIQCYLDCGRDVALGLKMFKNKYPDRRKPLLRLLVNIVENDHLSGNLSHSLQAMNFKKSLDDSIVNYFVKNSQATIRKAACIYSLPIRCVTHVLVDREVEIEAMRKANEIIRKQESFNNYLQETIEQTKQNLKREILGITDSEEIMNTTMTVLNSTGNSQEEFSIKEEDESNMDASAGVLDDTGNSQVKFNIKVEDESNIESSEGVLDYTVNSQEEFYIKVEDESDIEASEGDKADSDTTYCKTKTKKRKKKYSKCGNSKRIRASERISRCASDYSISLPVSSATSKPYRKRSTVHSPAHSSSPCYLSSSQNGTTLDTQTCRPMVYTRRLEEMAIWQKNIDHLDKAVIINEILAESKPRFNNIIQRSKRKAIKTVSLRLLKMLLNRFKNKDTVTGRSEKAYKSNDDDDISIVTDEDGKAKKFNVLQKNTTFIVIDNMFSNLRDTYIIRRGNLLEYHCTKLDRDVVEMTSKATIALSVCCWFGRQQNVETTWPSDKYPFSRFLKSRHTCSLDKCACCCRPLNNFTVPDTNEVLCTSIVHSNAKHSDLILSALNYKKLVAKCEITVSKTCNKESQNCIPTRLLISDFSKDSIRKEYFEIDSNQDILRFHVDNNWHTRRAQCKVCINLMSIIGQTINSSACCKWKRDSILRRFVSPNTLRFLQHINITFLLEKCCACEVESKSVIKKTMVTFGAEPKIAHATMIEKHTFSKLNSKVKPLDVHNTVQMPVVTSTFEVKKKVTIRCKQLPNLIFEICGLKNQEVNNIIQKLMHMQCTIKDDLRVVGLFDSSIGSTTTEELQMFAQIIQHLQNNMKVTPLPSGSSLSLVAEVIDDFKNNSIDQSDFKTEHVEKGNIEPPEAVAGLNQNNLPFIIKEVGADTAPHFSKVTSQKNRAITNTGGTAESIANVDTSVNEINKVTDKLTTTDGFENFFRNSKKCYEKSFRSYIREHNVKNEDNMIIPKISSVFSLQSSTQSKIPTNNLFSTQDVASISRLNPESSLPTSYNSEKNSQNDIIFNANVQNNIVLPYPHSILPPTVQETCQNMIICDPSTGQMFNLIPVDPNAIVESSMKQNLVTIQPDARGGNHLNLLPLQPDPLRVSSPSTPVITTNYETMETESILPDIINDIPKHVIDKKEPNNYEVIVLDSD